MPSEDIKISELIQYQKFDKAAFIIFADLECIIEKIDGCKNNHEIPSSFSMPTILPFRSIENKHNVYKGKDCMITFCKFLKKQVMKMIN